MKIYDNFFQFAGKLSLGVLCLVPTLLSPVQAQEFTPAELSQSLTEWAQQQVAISGGSLAVEVYPLDPRQSSRFCNEALQFEWLNPNLQSQNTAKISCSSPTTWQLFVSVKLSEMVDAVVSSRQLAAGTVLNAGDASLERRDIRQTRGQFIVDPHQIEGARLKRSISQGQLLKLSDFCLVCKGDLVTIEGVSAGLSVTTTGKALADGTLGEFVRVQNQQSGRVVQAQVQALKKVAIIL